MRPEDFFIEQQASDPFSGGGAGIFGDAAPGFFGPAPATPPKFNLDLLRQVRTGAISSAGDVEVAVALTRLVHDDLEAFGTGGGEELSENDMREALTTLRALLLRVGLSELEVPFRDYQTFKTYWLRNDGYNSWQARRDILNRIFGPMHDALADLETQAMAGGLADAVSPRGRTGWTKIDTEIAELRRHFANARTAQDYRNVGNDCVIVLEALSREIYDPTRHLASGEEEPPIGNTKARLGRVVECEAPGAAAAALRKLVRASIEFAQEVKHRDNGTRKEAGLAADAVILVANLMRRLNDQPHR
jgi:hypothetical protein